FSGAGAPCIASSAAYTLREDCLWHALAWIGCDGGPSCTHRDGAVDRNPRDPSRAVHPGVAVEHRLFSGALLQERLDPWGFPGRRRCFALHPVAPARGSIMRD